MEKSKVLIQLLPIFRQSGDVLFSLCARRLRGYTATTTEGFPTFFGTVRASLSTKIQNIPI